MKKHFYDLMWCVVFAGIAFFVVSPDSRTVFVSLTSAHPILMGFLKFAVLATMGELLVKRYNVNRLCERIIVWGFLGIVIAFVLPIYSGGVDLLISKNMLPVLSGDAGAKITAALWKSFWMNILFSFPLMTFHRITDMLIEKRKLFRRWPFLVTWKQVDWDNMWRVVAPPILWFWIPVHTVTYLLAPEFRVIMAAALSICLGAILSFAKLKAAKEGAR